MIPIRILSAQPSKDGEKWTITAQRHNDDWFLDAYGQNPQPFYRNPFSTPRNGIPYPWRTGLTPNSSTDPLLPFPDSSAQVYRSGPDVYVFGALPVNKLSPLVGAPQVPLQATVGDDGSIDSGTYLFQVCALDENGDTSAPSIFVTAVVTGADKSITIPNVVWSANAAGYRVFAGPDSMHMWSVFDDNTTPSSIEIDSLAPLYTLTGYDVGRPDINANSFRVIVTKIRHAGIWGAGVTAVGTHTLTIPHAPTVDEYAGRVISRLASSTIINNVLTPSQRDGLSIGGGLHMAVSANDNAGVITVPNTLGTGGENVAVGDAFVVRAYANIASANTIGDSGFVSDFAPSGLATDAEKGKLVWIYSGKGKGQIASIASNTGTTCTIDGAWQVVPDSTSAWMILEPSEAITAETQTFQNSAVGSAGIGAVNLIARVTVPLTEAGTYLVRVATEDRNGRTSIIAYAPWQEVYLTADAAQKDIDSTPYDMQPWDAALTLKPGASVVNIPALSTLRRETIWLINESGGDITVNMSTGDTIEGASSKTIHPDTRYQLLPRV
jgi:hypothetical protein